MRRLAMALLLASALLINAVPAFAATPGTDFGTMISQHAMEHAIQNAGDFGQCVSTHATTGSCPDM